MVGERDDVVLGRQLGEESVGRRTGIAALAGEQLDHAQRLVGLRPVGLGRRLPARPVTGKRREGQRKSRKPQ